MEFDLFNEQIDSVTGAGGGEGGGEERGGRRAFHNFLIDARSRKREKPMDERGKGREERI